MNRKNSLRGCIIQKWKDSGSPETVKYEQVLEWAKDCDHDFSRQGFNPAQVFRNHLKHKDGKYLRTYLRAERFPFRIAEDYTGTISVQQMVRSNKILASGGAWRACLICGRLNIVDAVYCSYCGKAMPRDTK